MYEFCCQSCYEILIMLKISFLDDYLNISIGVFNSDTMSKAYNQIGKQVKAECDGDKVFEGNKTLTLPLSLIQVFMLVRTAA